MPLQPMDAAYAGRDLAPPDDPARWVIVGITIAVIIEVMPKESTGLVITV